MREKKFRGKRKSNGEWVYGYLCESVFDEVMIQVITITRLQRMHDTFAVIPATVGQFTGLKDKSGKEIYEGDIYLAERGYMPSRGYKKKGYPDRITVICVVEWSVYDAGWYGREVSPIKDHIEFSKNSPYDYLFTSLHGSSNGTTDWVELIGNIHDNPELLTPLKGERINTMITDPNVKQEEATQAEGQAAATESAAQDSAMEVDSEEGTTEG